MNWNNFKTQLSQYSDFNLQFQYTETDRVNPSYHITQIKQLQITSVDCGGRLDSWPEIIVQLWEPETAKDEKAMEVNKALKIIDIVEAKLALHPSAEVKIEYGNPSFGTRQMPVAEIRAENSNLTVVMKDDTTQCKASDVCGKPKVKLSELTPASACCGPESSCC